MIKYKASDLVNAAMKLADLENTSFITAAENRMYINDAWCFLYQQAIDNGEQYYLSTFSANEGENNLPEDFHQLYDIYDSEYHTKIKRYNKDMDPAYSWYRIKNNKLYLNKVKTAEISYYPEPTTLDIEGTGDTELAFPSNLYKQIMIYRLAEYYKIRQGADITGIELLINQSLEQFYDMLNRDDNDNLVMRDVYNNNMVMRY